MDRGLPSNLLVAVLHPPLAVGALVVSGKLYVADAHPVLTVAAFLVTGVLWLCSIALEANMFLTFLGAVALLVTFGATWTAIESGVMLDRGVRTDCVVTEIHKRTQTRTTYDANGHASTTTDTFYDHGLRCADPNVDGLTARYRVAEPGDPLAVDYDPDGRVAPLPATSTDSHGMSLRIALFGLLAAVVLRVGAVVWEYFFPF